MIQIPNTWRTTDMDIVQNRTELQEGTGESGEGFLRISYAYSLDELKLALGRLGAFIDRMRNQ